MKSIHTLGLMGAMLTAACVSGAQTNVVGVPLKSAGNPGGSLIALVTNGTEGQVHLVGEAPIFPYTTTFPGDRVLVNSTGGNDPSNWLAVLRFFNPSDPTGSLGLPATEFQTYSPATSRGGLPRLRCFLQPTISRPP